MVKEKRIWLLSRGGYAAVAIGCIGLMCAFLRPVIAYRYVFRHASMPDGPREVSEGTVLFFGDAALLSIQLLSGVVAVYFGTRGLLASHREEKSKFIDWGCLLLGLVVLVLLIPVV